MSGELSGIFLPAEHFFQTEKAAARPDAERIIIQMVPEEAVVLSEALASHRRIHENVHTILRRCGFSELDCGECHWEGEGLAWAIKLAVDSARAQS